MSDPVTRAEANLTERVNYLESALMTEEGLEEAIRALAARKAVAEDPSENALIRSKLLELRGELQKVRSELVLYTAHRSRFRPPAKSNVDEVKELVEELDSLVLETVETHNVLGLAGRLLEIWSGTRAGETA